MKIKSLLNVFLCALLIMTAESMQASVGSTLWRAVTAPLRWVGFMAPTAAGSDDIPVNIDNDENLKKGAYADLPSTSVPKKEEADQDDSVRDDQESPRWFSFSWIRNWWSPHNASPNVHVKQNPDEPNQKFYTKKTFLYRLENGTQWGFFDARKAADELSSEQISDKELQDAIARRDEPHYDMVFDASDDEIKRLAAVAESKEQDKQSKNDQYDDDGVLKAVSVEGFSHGGASGLSEQIKKDLGGLLASYEVEAIPLLKESVDALYVRKICRFFYENRLTLDDVRGIAIPSIFLDQLKGVTERTKSIKSLEEALGDIKPHYLDYDIPGDDPVALLARMDCDIATLKIYHKVNQILSSSEEQQQRIMLLQYGTACWQRACAPIAGQSFLRDKSNGFIEGTLLEKLSLTFSGDRFQNIALISQGYTISGSIWQDFAKEGIDKLANELMNQCGLAVEDEKFYEAVHDIYCGVFSTESHGCYNVFRESITQTIEQFKQRNAAIIAREHAKKVVSDVFGRVFPVEKTIEGSSGSSDGVNQRSNYGNSENDDDDILNEELDAVFGKNPEKPSLLVKREVVPGPDMQALKAELMKNKLVSCSDFIEQLRQRGVQLSFDQTSELYVVGHTRDKSTVERLENEYAALGGTDVFVQQGVSGEKYLPKINFLVAQIDQLKAQKEEQKSRVADENAVNNEQLSVEKSEEPSIEQVVPSINSELPGQPEDQKAREAWLKRQKSLLNHDLDACERDHAESNSGHIADPNNKQVLIQEDDIAVDPNYWVMQDFFEQQKQNRYKELSVLKKAAIATPKGPRITQLLPQISSPEMLEDRKWYVSKPFQTNGNIEEIDIANEASPAFRDLLELHAHGERRSFFFGNKNRYKKAHYVLLVSHGTFAQDSKSWFDPKTPNFKAVMEFVEKSVPGDVEIVPLRWSGKNTHEARLNELPGVIVESVDYFQGDNCPAKNCKIIILGHSHFGNGLKKASKKFKQPIHMAITLNTPIREEPEYQQDAQMIEWRFHGYSYGDPVGVLGSADPLVLAANLARYLGNKNAVGARKDHVQEFVGRGFNCNMHYVLTHTKEDGTIEALSVAPTHSDGNLFLRSGLPKAIEMIRNGWYGHNNDLDVATIVQDGNEPETFVAPRRLMRISDDQFFNEEITRGERVQKLFMHATGGKVPLNGFKPSALAQLYAEADWRRRNKLPTGWTENPLASAIISDSLLGLPQSTKHEHMVDGPSEANLLNDLACVNEACDLGIQQIEEVCQSLIDFDEQQIRRRQLKQQVFNHQNVGVFESWYPELHDRLPSDVPALTYESKQA